MSKTRRILISVGVALGLSHALANEPPLLSSISPEDKSIIDQLTACISTAQAQGLSTVNDIENHCTQQVIHLEASLPGLPDILIESALN